MLHRITIPKRFRILPRITLWLALIVAAMTALPASAQEVAVKTNLLYDATTTPNLGVEVGLGGKSSLNIVYGLNPWKFSSASHGQRFAKHWLVMPEYRWWTCSRLSGHFLGIHALGGQLNVANVDFPVPGFFVRGTDFPKIVKDNRCQGWYFGGGLTYGYEFALSRHWNLEAEIGVGCARIRYDRYPCGNCGTRIAKAHANYIGVTKLGLSIMYIF